MFDDVGSFVKHPWVIKCPQRCAGSNCELHVFCTCVFCSRRLSLVLTLPAFGLLCICTGFAEALLCQHG